MAREDQVKQIADVQLQSPLSFDTGSIFENNIHHVIILTVAPVLLLANAAIGRFDLFDWPFISALLILLLGVPHGAFDIAVIQHRWSGPQRVNLLELLVMYVGLVVVVIAAWSVLPGGCLAAFLIASAYHFSGDWPSFHKPASRLLIGAALLSATAQFHQDQDRDIFELLTSTEAAAMIAATLHAASAPLMVAAGILAVNASRQSPGEAIEYALVLSLALFLPPITFFVIYFCLVHSVRHAIDVRLELRQTPTIVLLSKAAPYAGVAVASTLGGGLVVSSAGIGLDMLSTVFIVLAALTVPHMLLVDKQGDARTP